MFFLFTLVLLLLFLYGVKYKSGWNEDYLGKEQANAIKGLFIIFLTVGHIILLVLLPNGLYPEEGLGNKIELSLHLHANQLVVVMFLFFSGFGVSEGIKCRGGGYIKSIPKRRVLNTWINYAIGITIYLLLSPITGKEVEWTGHSILLYMICQKSIGAPTWYIFIIILCYIATWAAARIFYGARYKMTLLLALYVFIISIILLFFKDYWWYNTIYCYVFGFAYSQYKKEIEIIVRHKYLLWLFVIYSIFLLLNVAIQITTIPQIFSFNLYSIFFVMLFVMLGMKFKVGNQIINWFGKHLFPLYMYQGLTYSILFNIGGEKHSLVSWSPFIFALICLLLTMIIAKFYNKWQVDWSK